MTIRKKGGLTTVCIRQNGFSTKWVFQLKILYYWENGYSTKWVFDKMGFSSARKLDFWKTWEMKFCGTEILWYRDFRYLDFWKVSQPFLCVYRVSSAPGCHFCACLNSVLQHFKHMKTDHDSAKNVDVFHEMPWLPNRAQTEPNVTVEGQESLGKRK